jgi:hypothetical protein
VRNFFYSGPINEEKEEEEKTINNLKKKTIQISISISNL